MTGETKDLCSHWCIHFLTGWLDDRVFMSQRCLSLSETLSLSSPIHSFYDNRSSIINSTVGRSKLSDVRDKTSSLNVEKTQVFFYISKRRKQYRDCTYTLYLDSKLRKFLVINKFMLKNIFSFFFLKRKQTFNFITWYENFFFVMTYYNRE